MSEYILSKLLQDHYGLKDFNLRFLRDGGSRTYIVDGQRKYFLKVIGNAFADTANQSVSVMRFLENNDFPVPKTYLTQSGEALLNTSIDGEDKLILLQEYIDGQEPDLSHRAADIGRLTGRFHALMERYPHKLATHGRQFFIDRYLNILRKKQYPQITAYESLAEKLWQKIKDQPITNSHGDLHRGNLLEDRSGKVYITDFDTVCCAPAMFDIMVMCDMTDYFNLTQDDIVRTINVYHNFLSAYQEHRPLIIHEIDSFTAWVAIRHFQLQATILEIHGLDCITDTFIDKQLQWLNHWIAAIDLCL